MSCDIYKQSKQVEIHQSFTCQKFLIRSSPVLLHQYSLCYMYFWNLNCVNKYVTDIVMNRWFYNMGCLLRSQIFTCFLSWWDHEIHEGRQLLLSLFIIQHKQTVQTFINLSNKSVFLLLGFGSVQDFRRFWYWRNKPSRTFSDIKAIIAQEFM